MQKQQEKGVQKFVKCDFREEDFIKYAKQSKVNQNSERAVGGKKIKGALDLPNFNGYRSNEVFMT